ncbi:MAG: hypothetical protein AB7T27_02810 [Kiritimatiellia bacterium]
MLEKPDKQQTGQTDFRTLTFFTLCLILISLTYAFAQVLSDEESATAERVITNVADLEVWLNGHANPDDSELVIDFESFEPLVVRNELIPVISNAAAVFPVHFEQGNGHFRLFNANSDQIYEKNDDICVKEAEKDAILVPLSELALWLYAEELLESQNQPEGEEVPMVGTFDPKTSNDWNFSAENFQSLEKSPEKVPTIGKIETESYSHWKKSEDEALPELLERLADEMSEQQAQWLPIMPPSTGLVLNVTAQPSPTLIKVSEMIDGLLCESGTCGRIYPVTAKEKDKETKGRERRFFNKKEELLGVAECETNYNPHSWVEQKFPDLDTMPEEEREWLKSVYDPKRISITYDLTLTDPALMPASVPEPIQPISYTIDGGSNHTVYARYDGTAWAWGDNSFGQLGLGETGIIYYMSRQIESLSNIVAVAAGDKFSAWLDESGMVFIAGIDPSALQQFSNPVRLENVPAMQAISAGPEHLLMLDRQGDVWVSGRVGLGHPLKAPFKISGIGGIREIAAGEKDNLALDGQGNVYRWDTPQSGKKTPEKISGLSAITAIAAGRDHYLALTASGRIQTWGKNECGQLGLGDHRTRKDPALIAALTNISSIAADGMHSLALDASGDGWAWGANQFGQLGDGTTNNALVPVPMNGITHAVGVAAGERHSLALQSSGITVWSVGYNSFGQLGSGYETILKQPREIDSDGDGLLDSWEYKSTGTLTEKTGSGQTAIEYLDIAQTTGKVSLMLGYPDGFTNRLDIFSCTNLMESKWTLRETTNVQPLANWIAWEDATDTDARYYAAGNADFDGDADGLSDARERFVYGSSVTTNDTDGDGLNDGWEVANELDPLSAEGDDGALGDPDFDSLSNLEECAADANPWSFDSIIVLSPDDLYDGVTLRRAVPGRGIQYRSVTAWRSKCGFPGLVPSTPPRYFRRKIHEETGSWSYDESSGSCFDFASGSRYYHWEKVWDVLACELQSEIYGGDAQITAGQNSIPPPPCISPADICTTYGYWNADGSEAEYTRTEGSDSCCEPYDFPDTIGDPVETPGLLTYTQIWDGTATSYPRRTVHKEVTEEVSGEYTTQELIVNTRADLDGCGPLTEMEWGEGKYSRHVEPFDNMFSCKLSVSAYAAFRDLNTNENYITLAKLGYRFRAENLQTGQLYRLNWLEIFTPEGGGAPVVFKTKTIVFRGTGDIQPIEDATCVIDPPAFDGEIAPLVIRLNLNVDSDYDGIITAADDPIELSAGGIVGLNQDDDDGNGIPDKDYTGAVAYEDDLELISIDLALGSLHTGTLTLEALTGGDKVKIWGSAIKETPVTLPVTWDVATDVIPTNLYVEGVNESTALRDVEFRLRYAANGKYLDENIKMTVVKTDLDVDSDYDGDIDEADDDLEIDPGGLVAVNLDDDNGNNIPDKDETNVVSGENDLEPVSLLLTPQGLAVGKLRLEAVSGSANVKVWLDAAKGTEIILPKEWSLVTDTIPQTLYIEGNDASTVERDVEFKLGYLVGATDNADTNRLTVFRFKFITPDGDPVGAPVDTGIGQNEFTFSASAIGILEINLKSEVIPHSSSIASIVADSSRYEVAIIGSSVLSWDTANPNGKPTANTHYLEAKAVFTALPLNNTGFGEKFARVFFENNRQQEQKYEVFFDKTAANHPGGLATDPNWFYYWQDGNVCGISSICLYDLTASYGYCLPGTDNFIRLGPDAPEVNTGPEAYSSSTYGSITVTGQGRGIRCVAETIQHEQHHLDIYNAFHSRITTAHANGGAYNGDPDDDPDGETIPNVEEPSYDGIASDPNDPDSYNMGGGYSGYGDNEVRCRKIELDLTIPIYPDRDWANPGCQSKNEFGP